MPNIGGNKFSHTGVSLKWVKSKRLKRERKDRKLVITMATYALKHHLGWRTQAAWDKSGQLLFSPLIKMPYM